jgi:hypothetical protein
MTRYHKSLGVCLVAMFGMWGCAKGPVSTTSSNVNHEKIKALEVRANKLDEDLKAAVAAKDELQANLRDAAQFENELHQEIALLQMVVKERDQLKAQLKTRTAERDLLHAKYDGFLKELDELTGRAKSALQNPKPGKTGIAANEAAPSTGVASGETTGPFLNGGF